MLENAVRERKPLYAGLIRDIPKSPRIIWHHLCNSEEIWQNAVELPSGKRVWFVSKSSREFPHESAKFLA
jgi:hypothetical protein